MSNTYFKLNSEKRDEFQGQVHEVSSDLTLTAFVGWSNTPNSIQMTIITWENNRGRKNTLMGYISLNEEQQNQLIAGILERRGGMTSEMIEQLSNYLIDIDPAGISVTGNEQSFICPYTEDNDIV